MSDPSLQSLDYASPSTHRRADPDRWPPIPLLAATLLLAASLWSTGFKVNPGGPFISLHADAAPALLSLALLGIAWRSLRHGPLWRRLTVAAALLCAVALILLVLDSVISFWTWPTARGALVSW